LENQFPGYYRRSEKDLETIWQDGLLVLDANVLLNPYRYSEETREELFRILSGVQDRLWIPHQVAEEFHRNRLDVIRGQKEAFAEVRTTLSEVRRLIESKVNAIHKDAGIDTKSILEKVKESFDTLLAETKKLENDSGARSVPESYSPEDDEIWKAIINIVEGRVGEGLAPERMQEVRSEGPRRYASEVPPGYEDIDKPGDRKYGDLIFWFQIIDMAKETEKPILLVTDDRKEDWWQRSGGKAVEPHPDLVNEMHHEGGVLFHMMLPLKFLRWAGKKLDREISQQAAEEIEGLRSLEEQATSRFEDIWDEINIQAREEVASLQQGRMDDLRTLRDLSANRTLWDVYRNESIRQEVERQHQDLNAAQYLHEAAASLRESTNVAQANKPLRDPSIADYLRLRNSIPKDIRHYYDI
jgi:hypothetical protein